MAKSSLSKSHSVFSNTKLTVLSLITIVCFTLMWLSIAYYLYQANTFVLIIGIISLLVFICCLIGFSKFKR